MSRSLLLLPPDGYRRRRQVLEQVADADLGTRLMGHEVSVEGREGEAREMIGLAAPGVEAEDYVHLGAQAHEHELAHPVDDAMDVAFARVDGLRRHRPRMRRRTCGWRSPPAARLLPSAPSAPRSAFRCSWTPISGRPRRSAPSSGGSRVEATSVRCWCAGSGPLVVPRLDRLYFRFGAPIPTTRWAGRANDPEARAECRDIVKAEVAAHIEYLLSVRDGDPQRRLLPRPVEGARTALGGSATAGARGR